MVGFRVPGIGSGVGEAGTGGTKSGILEAVLVLDLELSRPRALMTWFDEQEGERVIYSDGFDSGHDFLYLYCYWSAGLRLELEHQGFLCMYHHVYYVLFSSR